MTEHQFTANIKLILKKYFGDTGVDVFQHSPLIQYLNRKTKSANSGSKSRGSFANIYAIYILVEDYIANGFHNSGDYTSFPGSVYTNLFKRQRELPFGTKLQNHALNNRLNSEFENWFPTLEIVPIIRTAESDRYWINENLLKLSIGGKELNLATAVIEIIQDYIATKKDSFDKFLIACERLQILTAEDSRKVQEFILSQLAPNVDARLFEIISYAILKYYYYDQVIYWGYEPVIGSLKKENLSLFKTGRTNANDGGIDFVMKPLGRFFQVTETLDFKKYFLDIDKLQRYPVTFVVKSEEQVDTLYRKIEREALRSYSVQAVVKRYINCIEELINIPIIKQRFEESIKMGHLSDILNEIVIQSKVEFNYEEDIESEPLE